MVYAGGTGIALFPASTEAPAAAPNAKITAIMRHLAFRVDYANFLAAQKTLGDQGIKFDFQDHGIAHSIYLRDPDGYEIELTTYDIPGF